MIHISLCHCKLHFPIPYGSLLHCYLFYKFYFFESVLSSLILFLCFMPREPDEVFFKRISFWSNTFAKKKHLKLRQFLKDGPRLCTPNIFCIFFHFPIEFSGNLERKVFYSLHKCSSSSFSSIIYDCSFMEDMILILFNIHL